MGGMGGLGGRASRDMGGCSRGYDESLGGLREGEYDLERERGRECPFRRRSGVGDFDEV